MWPLQFYILALFLFGSPVTGKHFRYATISCRTASDNASVVTCAWRAAFRIDDGPCQDPCTQANVGQLATRYIGAWWCYGGCSPVVSVAELKYYVTGVDPIDKWQQGRNEFNYDVPHSGLFTFGMVDCCWVTLETGAGKMTKVITEYNAGIRNDTGKPNASPITTTNPLVNMDITCGYQFDIPNADADGDIVRCRWAIGYAECGNVCGPLPGSTLYPNCTLIIPSSKRSLYGSGFYAVAIMLEDFPATNITQGGVQKDETTPLSKVPLQYLARIKDCNCANRPTFTTTPETRTIYVGQTFTKNFIAIYPSGINTINVIPPTGANVGAMVTVNGTTASVNITWTPTTAQLGQTLVCYQAFVSDRCSGPYLCDKLTVDPSDDGEWCTYSDWSDCSVTCENGTKTRSRECKCPEPAYGGTNCVGAKTETQYCSAPPCPVDGGWCTYSDWTDCSVTCEDGTQTRSRECNCPAPAHGGANCVGATTETQSCSGPPCPVDGGWCTYSDWSDCSVTCENGTQTRSRECNCPEPAYGGATCVGATTETQYCSGPCCPVDGYLSNWLPWSSCSATCGLPGTVTRLRTKECIYPVPDCPGDDCGQPPEEYENCTQKPCCTTSAGSPGSFQHDRGNRLHGLRVNFRGANTNDKYVTFRCGIVLIESIQNYDETYVADVQAAVTDVCTEQSRRVCQVTIPAPPGCPCQVMIKYMCCNTLY